jgi:hypothetical protein
MQIRKLLAGGMAAAMAGTTMAFGAIAVSENLGGYVDGTTVPSIVIGSSAGSATEYPKDVAAAADVAAAMAGYATETVNIAGGTTTSVSGGADIATTNTKLYFKSVLNRARSTLTSTQLPVLLESGTFTDDAGTAYAYDQYINLAPRQTEFDRDNGIFTDPTLYVGIGSDAKTTPAYNVTLVFSKALNVSHTDVQGGTIEIANVDYTVEANSQSGTSGSSAKAKLVLLGGAGSTVVDVDGSAEVALGGMDHTVEVQSVADTSTAVIVVDGKLKEVTEGNTYSLTGDKGTVDVYVKGVYYAGTTGTGTSSVEVVLGVSKLTLDNNQAAKSGTSATTIQGTHVFITSDDGGISKVEISVSGPEASEDAIAAGGSFFDPVLMSFKMAFHGMTPALDDSARDMITIDNAGTTGVHAIMTDYRGNDKTFQFIYNGTSQPQLNQSSTKMVHVVEGARVSLNDYFLIAPSTESDFGHIMQLTAMTNVGGSNPRFTLTDAFTASTMEFYFDRERAFKTFYVDGQTYYAYNVSGTQKMNFTWGNTGASDGDTGNKTTIFPLVRLAGGEYITFIQNQSLNISGANSGQNAELSYNVSQGEQHVLELPTGDLNITVSNATTGRVRLFVNSTAINIVADGSENVYDVSLGQLTYKLGLQTSNKSAGIASGNDVGVLVKWIHPATTYYQANNNDNLVGVMVLQEADNTTSTKDAIITGIDYSTTDGLRVEQIAAGMTGSKDGEARSSNSNILDYVNVYGTKITYDTVSEGQGKTVIKYPDDQAVITVAFGIEPVFSEAATGGSYEAALKITSPVTKLDNEVTATSALSDDLILLGGPCANSVVAALLTDAGETCSDWSYSTGLIKEVEDAFGSGQMALIIAGTSADDTRSLAAQVLTGTMSYAV